MPLPKYATLEFQCVVSAAAARGDQGAEKLRHGPKGVAATWMKLVLTT